MKSIIALVFACIVCFVSISQPSSGIELNYEDFPALDKVWGPVEYNKTLEVLRQRDSANQSIPLLKDSHAAAFYDRLASVENLAVFTDQSLSLQTRINLIFPHFDVLPDYIAFFLNNEMLEEGVFFTQFILECTKSLSLLGKEFMLEHPNVDDELVNSLSQPMMQILDGALIIMEEIEDVINPLYIESLADWFNVNYLILMDMLNNEGRENCKKRFENLSKFNPNKQVRKAMGELVRKLN